jgi:hypothetical protein
VAGTTFEIRLSPATRIETSHFSKNFDAVDADADDENRGDCCRKDFSALVVADGYAVGFVSGAVAKFDRKINIAPSTRINRAVAIAIVTLKNHLPSVLVLRLNLASDGCFDRTTS